MIEVDAEALKAALLGNQVNGKSPHTSRERLKKLVNGNRWATIGHMFGFEPKFMTVSGVNVFDWNSCNEAFWAVYKVQLEPKLEPRLGLLTSSRGEQPVAKPRPKVASRADKQRRKLWDAQQGKCYYCRQPCQPGDFTLDHVVPVSKGGGDGMANKVGACLSCNNAKGSMSQAEFLKSHYLESKSKWFEVNKRNAEVTPA